MREAFLSTITYNGIFLKKPRSSKNKNNTDEVAPPTVSTIIPRSLVTTKDFKEKFPSVIPRTWAVGRYSSSIRTSSISAVKEDCRCQDLDIIASDLTVRVALPRGGLHTLHVSLFFGSVFFEWRTWLRYCGVLFPLLCVFQISKSLCVKDNYLSSALVSRDGRWAILSSYDEPLFPQNLS